MRFLEWLFQYNGDIWVGWGLIVASLILGLWVIFGAGRRDAE